MRPKGKISPVKTDDSRSDSSDDHPSEPPVSSEQSLQAENKPPDHDVQQESSAIQIFSKPDLLAERANQPLPVGQYASDKLQDHQPIGIISSEQKVENIPLADQPLPKVKCPSSYFDAQSEKVEIHVASENKPDDEQQFAHPSEKHAKEDKCIALQKDEDTIEELSDAPRPPTNPSSSEVEKEIVEESCIVKFLKKRLDVAQKQMENGIYAICFLILFLIGCGIFILYMKNIQPTINDIFLSYMIVISVCFVSTLLLERGKYSWLYEKLEAKFDSSERNSCCKRREDQTPLKQSQYTPSKETDAPFQHEIAEVETENIRYVPHLVSREQGSLDSRSTDNLDQQFVVAAEFHEENVETPEHHAEGACGYSPSYASGACGYTPRSEDCSSPDP